MVNDAVVFDFGLNQSLQRGDVEQSTAKVAPALPKVALSSSIENLQKN